VTEALSERGLYLPSGLGLQREDQRRVIDAVKAFFRARS
jgi:dTDP-4-amino-4,6-dideoxygalactose transaminase